MGYDTRPSKNRSSQSRTTTRSNQSRATTGFTLQRRLSTATPVNYNMYLMNITTMLKLFGSSSDRKKNLQLCHQDLLETETMLTRFEDLPMGTFVMYVSHQWNGFQHPDPHGRQLEVLCKVTRDLR